MLTQLIFTAAGWVAAAWTQNGLAALTFPQNSREEALAGLNEKLLLWGFSHNCPSDPVNDDPGIKNSDAASLVLLENALVRYFQGVRVNFDLPVDLSWCTPFQKKVLDAIRQIPYGEVRSYSQVAAMAGRPGAARAVGRTAGANRTPIVIPCHRVTRQNGGLGGFGGGLERKKYLLDLEAGIQP